MDTVATVPQARLGSFGISVRTWKVSKGKLRFPSHHPPPQLPPSKPRDTRKDDASPGRRQTAATRRRLTARRPSPPRLLALKSPSVLPPLPCPVLPLPVSHSRRNGPSFSSLFSDGPVRLTLNRSWGRSRSTGKPAKGVFEDGHERARGPLFLGAREVVVWRPRRPGDFIFRALGGTVLFVLLERASNSSSRHRLVARAMAISSSKFDQAPSPPVFARLHLRSRLLLGCFCLRVAESVSLCVSLFAGFVVCQPSRCFFSLTLSFFFFFFSGEERNAFRSWSFNVSLSL